ncbi:DDT domain-containing protein DDR4 [Vigna radiata var. radiata]|uniref:DDT domain-containing protein DDR4 n=1 Tax=Vigna radiata var. radiata TaxID=3916 RepID=A0A1S3UVG4_VIGRR|nr:DDT domain-containing protein DDR4 [Vigna radiata var. radiata]XP_014509952.1 DDT domain-containing protein DDR4 [Vigna radiata var. radiata]
MSNGSPPLVTCERSLTPEADPSNNVSDSKEETAVAPPLTTRSARPSRACTMRPPSRLLSSPAKKEVSPPPPQCSKIVTPLVEPPSPSQLPRWNLRTMWEFASVLNFLHLFMPLLNISLEFSAEELETALLTPNDTLFHIHMPLLKAIPPITRMALTRDTWITVLCRKLRDWWHWVADGDLPVVASHGVEIEVYKSLDPGIRVVILKAICDIRVEQEDIRSYIDNSIKHGVRLSTFRKERIGGDSNGISYWYEDDPIIGHRLYREIRKTEVIQMKKGKARGSQVLSSTSYQWEAVATNFDEFQDVSEKLFSSKNRTETSVGKKLKIDMLPEVEKAHKKKEKLLKKQHRQALLLDNYLVVDGLGPGRSLRDRKPVTYTFDDYDRSINEAIKVTKQKQPSPERMPRRESVIKPEALTNGKYGPLHATQDANFGIPSSESADSYDDKEDHENDNLDRSNRQRRRPNRYSEREFVEAVSYNEADFDSDDDIVGEAVYDEEYLEKRKHKRKSSSSSEGEEEHEWDEYNVEDDEEEDDDDDDDDDSLSMSEDSDKPRKVKQLPSRTRRETKLRSVGEIQSSLRRSKRATRNSINYRQYEASESETEFIKSDKSDTSADHSEPSENGEYMMESEDSGGSDDEEQETKLDEAVTYPATEENEQNQAPEKLSSPGQEEVESTGKRRFLDLNELAPTTGFDDGPNTIMKDEDNDY